MKFTLRQLEIFSAVARLQTVSRAAQQLSMSQSAASNALLELERQIGQPVFDRIGKSLHLNPLGRGVLPQVENLLGQAVEIEAYLQGEGLAPITVGATLTIGNYLGTLLLADYMAQHPQAEIRLHVANTQTVIERLLACECDIALIEGEVSHPELTAEAWMEDELVVFCAPTHPLAGVTAVDLPDLEKMAWILREPGSGTRRQFDRAIAARLGQFTLRLELEHTEAIKRAVESGIGVGCLSRLALREALRRGSLVELPTPGFDLKRTFYIVRHARRQRGRSSQVFHALCLRILGDAKRTAELNMPFIP